MVSLDVGESFELPHHTLLCSATGKTQEITSKWKCTCTCTRAHTLHMQSIERSDRQNKQLVPTPHNTLSVRPMTTPGPVAINSSSINYVFACWSFDRCTSFHMHTPHLYSPECLMWVFIEPLNWDLDKFCIPAFIKGQKSFASLSMAYLKMSHSVCLVIRDICLLFTVFFYLLSCVQYTRACVGMGVTLGRSSKGWQESCMHHKSLLSLVSSISSKQGRYGGHVPHLCLCAVGSRVESWSQTVNSKKVNPTAGILNNIVLTRTLGCFLSPPFSSPFPFASGRRTSTHTFLPSLPLAVGSCC